MTLNDSIRRDRFRSRQFMRGMGATTPPYALSADLPLDTEDAIIGVLPGDEEAALYDLGGGIGVHPETTHERIQDRFAIRIKKLAAALIAGTIGLLVWHRLMRDEIKQHAIQQALLGGEGKIDDIKRVDGLVRRETDYLSRFADEIARETPSSARIKMRATLYGGSGRAVFYREREARLPVGYIVEYHARDDGSTCKSCADADGNLYLPEMGLFPGEICLGHQRCRCTRIPRFDEAYATYLRTRV